MFTSSFPWAMKADIEFCRTEFVRWVAENKRPFQVVNDRAFQSLMKTGRPECYIPSAETVSRDVKNVFASARKRISDMLQVSFHSNKYHFELALTIYQKYNGKLNFATDAWTAPNHKAYMAITAHFEREGTPMAMLLDLVEVPRSHSGANLAEAFLDVLRAFGVEDKVSNLK